MNLSCQFLSLQKHAGNDAKADWKESKARGGTFGDKADYRSLGEQQKTGGHNDGAKTILCSERVGLSLEPPAQIDNRGHQCGDMERDKEEHNLERCHRNFGTIA